jgi:hypothetical protein
MFNIQDDIGFDQINIENFSWRLKDNADHLYVHVSTENC